jgi:hypothetical protein
MARIRFEDLLRHFAGDMLPVVAADAKNRREQRALTAEQKREDNAEKLKLRLMERDQARDARADERADAAERRAEEAAGRARADQKRQDKDTKFETQNPWIYNGMRFPTKEGRDQARKQDLETSAGITAANRQPRATSSSDTETGHTRVMTSARGDLERWYSRGPVTPRLAEGYLRDLYRGKLTEGEISHLVEEVRAEYDRSRSGARSGR